jgi:hypothetical protein
MKTLEEVRVIVAQVSYNCDNEWFVLTAKGDGYLLQLRYYEKDIDSGVIKTQHARTAPPI